MNFIKIHTYFLIIAVSILSGCGFKDDPRPIVNSGDSLGDIKLEVIYEGEEISLIFEAVNQSFDENYIDMKVDYNFVDSSCETCGIKSERVKSERFFFNRKKISKKITLPSPPRTENNEITPVGWNISMASELNSENRFIRYFSNPFYFVPEIKIEGNLLFWNKPYLNFGYNNETGELSESEEDYLVTILRDNEPAETVSSKELPYRIMKQGSYHIILKNSKGHTSLKSNKVDYSE